MWLNFFANVDLFMTETCKYAMGMSRITPGRKNAATVHYTQFSYRGDTLCGADLLDNLEDYGVIKTNW
jgi:hypothetical protein